MFGSSCVSTRVNFLLYTLLHAGIARRLVCSSWCLYCPCHQSYRCACGVFSPAPTTKSVPSPRACSEAFSTHSRISIQDHHPPQTLVLQHDTVRSLGYGWRVPLGTKLILFCAWFKCFLSPGQPTGMQRKTRPLLVSNN